MPDYHADSTLRRALDHCVKCGICLPECPTYRLTASENESPRGRLALIEGLLDGRLQATPALTRHLDSCLSCRRCERICPSRVPCGALFDAGRARVPGRSRARLGRWLAHASTQVALTRLARLLPTVLSRPLRRLHHAHRLARALDHTDAPPAPGVYAAPSIGRTAKRVGVFAGCTARAQQPGLVQAAVRLLQTSGCTVVIPSHDHCCGALAAHAGDSATAARHAAANRSLFNDVDVLVSLASGCGIHLDAYEPPLPVTQHDICDFLVNGAHLDASLFRPLPETVAVHVPCSVENVYQGARWAEQLLRLIPQITLQTVGETGQCCGAAGDHMLRQPRRAATLREPVLRDARALGARYLVTTNVGCAMHLAEGLDDAVGVLHPVELLARQLYSDTR